MVQRASVLNTSRGKWSRISAYWSMFVLSVNPLRHYVTSTRLLIVLSATWAIPLRHRQCSVASTCLYCFANPKGRQLLTWKVCRYCHLALHGDVLVDPMSATLAQHYINVRSMCRLCWDGVWLNPLSTHFHQIWNNFHSPWRSNLNKCGGHNSFGGEYVRSECSLLTLSTLTMHYLKHHFAFRKNELIF